MKNILKIFSFMVIMMVMAVSVYAGPADIPATVGDNSNFLGVTQGKNVPPICDGYGYIWYLQVVSPGNVAGTVDTGSCGIWNVTGTYDAVNVQLQAVNPSPGACVDWFIYTGTHTGRQGKTASGTWINSVGASGSWSAGLCK